MYDGTNGSTHGERKLSRPAAKATAMPKLADSCITTRPVPAAGTRGRHRKFHAVPLVVKGVLVGDNGQHPLNSSLVNSMTRPQRVQIRCSWRACDGIAS